MPPTLFGATRAIRYDSATVALHWVTAILVAVLWVSAHAIGWAGHGAPATLIRSGHITLGLLLIVVLLARLAWRLGPGRRLPAADRGAMHLAAKATHYGLYALLVGTALLGIANWLTHGGTLWGAVAIPKLDFSALATARTIRGWHGLAANAILILAGVHAAAALFHHYVWRDGVLGRMLPVARP